MFEWLFAILYLPVGYLVSIVFYRCNVFFIREEPASTAVPCLTAVTILWPIFLWALTVLGLVRAVWWVSCLLYPMFKAIYLRKDHE